MMSPELMPPSPNFRILRDFDWAAKRCRVSEGADVVLVSAAVKCKKILASQR